MVSKQAFIMQISRNFQFAITGEFINIKPLIHLLIEVKAPQVGSSGLRYFWLLISTDNSSGCKSVKPLRQTITMLGCNSYLRIWKDIVLQTKDLFLLSFFEEALFNGLKIITGIRANMKNKCINITEKLLRKKRGIIESLNEILMTICDIDHTRHRSPYNFLVNLIAGTIA